MRCLNITEQQLYEYCMEATLHNISKSNMHFLFERHTKLTKMRNLCIDIICGMMKRIHILLYTYNVHTYIQQSEHNTRRIVPIPNYGPTAKAPASNAHGSPIHLNPSRCRCMGEATIVCRVALQLTSDGPAAQARLQAHSPVSHLRESQGKMCQAKTE